MSEHLGISSLELLKTISPHGLQKTCSFGNEAIDGNIPCNHYPQYSETL